MVVAPQPRASGPLRCFAALAIGFVIVAGVNGTFSLLTGADLNLSEEWGIFLFQTLVVAAPFGLFALAGVRGRLPWIVAFALTATLWGIYLAVGLTAHGDGTGANIGLGLLMVVSPAFIAAAGLLAARLIKEV